MTHLKRLLDYLHYFMHCVRYAMDYVATRTLVRFAIIGKVISDLDVVAVRASKAKFKEFVSFQHESNEQ